MAITYDALGNVIGDIPDTPTVSEVAKTKKKTKPVVSTTSASATPGNANDVSSVGLPTQSPQTRGDVSGSINSTNQQLVHSCDFSLALQKNMALRKYIRAIAKWIREGIRKLRQSMSFGDPSGSYSEIINMLKAVAEYVQYVNDEYIQPIIEFEKYVLAVIVKIRAIIQWILSLPAKILAMLNECLTKMLKALGQIFTDEWAAAGAEVGAIQSSDSGKAFEELSAAAKSAYTATKDLLTASTTAAGLAVGIAVSGTVGLLQPTSEAEITAANATITSYTGSIPAGLEVPADPSFLKKSTP
jgi:hypothetical protein